MFYRYLKKWLPALAWAGVIFVFSTQTFSEGNTRGFHESLLREFFPALSGAAIDLIHLSIRKLGHLSEYSVLAVLILRAVADETDQGRPSNRPGLALTLTGLYAISDELHQGLVPGRSASSADVLVDLCGGIFGILWWQRRNRRKITAR